MDVVNLDSPALVLATLQSIEKDLAMRQGPFEAAAGSWYTAQREIKKAYATALLSSAKASVTEKKAEADIAASLCDGSEYEAEYEAIKAVVRILETRSTICMSILKAQGRS